MNIADVQKQAELLNDPSWFFCFDDGLTPELAVAEYQKYLAEEELKEKNESDKSITDSSK